MALAVGDRAPNFTTQDTQGNSISLTDFAGKTVILYFYPKDDTPGCTKESCSFRDRYDAYREKDLIVLGVSADDVTAHQQFSQKFNLPFPLLADIDGSIIRAYGVQRPGYDQPFASRVTYVINGAGEIIRVYESVQTETHATDILVDLGL
ncbi:MAG: peroxiredoxin [Oscillatoriales cyanobacterium SM2_2_1]|nr:peroxiredoxin [Oscillatoriales cyanobacterium SM2_2_1]